MPTPICLLVHVLVGVICLSQSWAQAPGDEDPQCTVNHPSPPQYPDTVRNLMDSYNYENLLPGHGTGDPPIATAVWNDFSFDGNDVTPETLNPTYWQQSAGGPCRYQSRVCGWRPTADRDIPQNNWLFTQHIGQDFDQNTFNYDVTIYVEVVYSVQSCRDRQGCTQGFNLLHYMTNSTQAEDTRQAGFMNTQNYQIFAKPYGAPSITYTNTYNFTLPQSYTGFYIAVQDIGSCIALSRLRVYRNNCKSRQVGLVLYPDTPAPESDTVDVAISCAETAFTCTSSGTWGTECQCKCGYMEISQVTGCIVLKACEAGEYRSEEDAVCQKCPSNTIGTRRAACTCPCLDGYFRNTENVTRPEALQYVGNPSEKPGNMCTKPPGVPRELDIVAVSPNDIEINWKPPRDDGGRTDLYYQVEHRDPDNLGTYTGTVYLGGWSYNHTFTSLRELTQYCVRVTAHNGVSNQNPGGAPLRAVEACVRTPGNLNTTSDASDACGIFGCQLSAGAVAAILSSGTILSLLLVCVIVAGCVLRRRRRKPIVSEELMSPTGNSYSIPLEFTNPSKVTDDSVQKPVASPVQQLREDLRNKNMLFSNSQLELSRVVGQGESGLVYRGYIRTSATKDLVAIKTGRALLSMDHKERLLKEVILMLTFDHPNVMPLIGLSFDGEMPLIVMPFMSRGNVLGYVRKHRKSLYFKDPSDHQQVEAARKTCLGMCYQICKGMSYLSKFKFVHRDLAARNCMIDDNDIIKVSDFGLTEDMYSTAYYRHDRRETGTGEKVPIKWMAPESIESNVFDESTDVWSFGVTCWEVFTCGGVPYAGVPVTTLLSELCSGHRLDRPSNITCSDDVWALMTSCWSVGPQERPKFATLVNNIADLLDNDPTYIKLQN